MSSLPWFRMYAEAVDNYKLRLVAYEDRWHYVAILCCKAQGILDGKRDDFVKRAVSAKLGLRQIELDEVIRRLSEVGLIDGKTMQPNAWEERQYKSDISTERSRKCRINKKTRNVAETLLQRDCNGSDTDTETDTEKHKSKRFAALRYLVSLGVDESVAQDWLAVRKLKKAANTATAFDAVLSEAQKAGLTMAQAVKISVENNWSGFKSSWVAAKQTVAQNGVRQKNGRTEVFREGIGWVMQ